MSAGNIDVVITNIIGTVISEMNVAGIININYQPGRSVDIVNNLVKLDNSITFKGKKFPLIAMLMPIREKRGSGFYSTVKIDRIVLATLSDPNADIITRYATGGTYPKVLYPMYNEFFRCLSRSTWITQRDPDSFIHEKMDNPSQQPIGQGLNDYVDTIDILNLEIIFNQLKNC